MSQVAADLSDETMREAARYYERLPSRIPETSMHPDAILRGSAIATRGMPERDIPACAECHGPTRLPKSPAYPTLAGQHAQYLRLQLNLLKERRRGGSPRVNLMHVFVGRLSAEQIADVTLYYASLNANTTEVPATSSAQ
jgi:cytochrome c553